MGDERRWEIAAVHPFRDRLTKLAGPVLRLGESVTVVPEARVAELERENARLERALDALVGAAPLPEEDKQR